MAFEFYERDRARAGGLLAGGLAFRLFLWLLPFALVVVTALGVALSISDRAPENVAKEAGFSAALATTVAQAVDGSRRGRFILLLLGLVLTVWAGMGVLRALRTVSALEWGVEPKGGGAIAGSVALSGIALLLFGAVGVASHLFGGPLAADLLISLGLSAGYAGVVAWAMWTLPHPQVSWTAMLPGAMVVAIGIEILKVATAVYFAPRLERVADLYGALGLAAVFLAWLYVVGRLMVTGISVNAAIWERRRRVEARGSPGSPPDAPPEVEPPTRITRSG
jgi:uncharacterized BrkB/YihY/UPF0761 family membrane protein